MLGGLAAAFRTPDLRKKILFTLGLLAVYRVGWQIPLPIVDPAKVAAFNEADTGVAGVLEIAEYFTAEVLDQQPPEVTRFMLDTSILGELTADACAAVTGRQDAAALLHSIDAANLFLVALDDDRTSFRYHPLVRQLLNAELRARDPDREQALHLIFREKVAAIVLLLFQAPFYRLYAFLYPYEDFPFL